MQYVPLVVFGGEEFAPKAGPACVRIGTHVVSRHRPFLVRELIHHLASCSHKKHYFQVPAQITSIPQSRRAREIQGIYTESTIKKGPELKKTDIEEENLKIYTLTTENTIICKNYVEIENLRLRHNFHSVFNHFSDIWVQKSLR